MLTGFQWNYERAQVFLATMRNAVKDYRVHAYLEGYVVINCEENGISLLTETIELWCMAASHSLLVLDSPFGQK